MNIMLVDDNKIDLFVSQKIIEKVLLNSTVRKFVNPVSAINFLKLLENDCGVETMFVPDIIFLDINMPEMDGFQFLKEFNKLAHIGKKCIKIYMLSSSTNSQDVQRAKKERHCIGFINKPLNRQSIENVITDINPCRTLLTQHECQNDSFKID